MYGVGKQNGRDEIFYFMHINWERPNIIMSHCTINVTDIVYWTILETKLNSYVVTLVLLLLSLARNLEFY